MVFFNQQLFKDEEATLQIFLVNLPCLYFRLLSLLPSQLIFLYHVCILKHVFVRLPWVLVAACRIFVASCSVFRCGAQAQELWRGLSSCTCKLQIKGPVVVVSRLSCPTVLGILVPWPGIKPTSLALQGGFLTTEWPGSPIMSAFLGHIIFTFCSVIQTAYLFSLRGFPGGASGKEFSCQYRRYQRHGFDCWVSEIPWRMAWQPGESHGQRTLACYSP